MTIVYTVLYPSKPLDFKFRKIIFTFIQMNAGICISKSGLYKHLTATFMTENKDTCKTL